jgi:hypothetical protein
LALRQEAHGYALDGDEVTCNRKLDEALRMVALSERNGDPGPGSYCTDVYLELNRATCWLELGRPNRAIDLFERELVRLPTIENRDHGCTSPGWLPPTPMTATLSRRRPGVVGRCRSSGAPALSGSVRNSAGCARGWSGGVTCL